MKKLRYFYGTMASAKSSNLLMKVHQFEQSGAKCLLLKPSQDSRVIGKIYSRIIPSRECELISQEDNIIEMVYSLKEEFDYIFIDEVQFLTREHIKQLWILAHKFGIDIFCYGLKLDYKNKLFPPAEELFILADTIEEIKSKCCFCSKKATTHLRYVRGKVTKEGDTVNIENIYGDDEIIQEYKSVCQNCWQEA
jgi:thymidine kinase